MCSVLYLIYFSLEAFVVSSFFRCGNSGVRSLAQDYTANRNTVLSLSLSVLLIHSDSDHLFAVAVNLVFWSFSEVSTLAAC